MKAPTRDTLRLYCVEVGDCLHWAQGTNNQGYPQANVDGKVVMMRRYVYAHIMGNELASRQPLSTRCGHKLCLSPVCLYATTMGAVLKKAYRQGKRSTQREYIARLRRAQKEGMAKLTFDQVDQIRNLPADISHEQAGRMFGVGPKAVSSIRRGLTWREYAPASSVFAWRP